MALRFSTTLVHLPSLVAAIGGKNGLSVPKSIRLEPELIEGTDAALEEYLPERDIVEETKSSSSGPLC